MKEPIEKHARRLALALTAALSGGTVFGSCEARIKDAFVSGTTSLIIAPQVGLVPSLGTLANPVDVTYTAEPF